MRVLAAVGVTALISRGHSEVRCCAQAPPPSSRVVVRSSAVNRPGCSVAGRRSARWATVASLRGGGFSWGSSFEGTRASDKSARDGKGKGRVPTRGPPDLSGSSNRRPPPTVPGTQAPPDRWSRGENNGYAAGGRAGGGGGGGGGVSQRDRVKTVGPPDAGPGAGGARRSSFGYAGPPPAAGQRQRYTAAGAAAGGPGWASRTGGRGSGSPSWDDLKSPAEGRGRGRGRAGLMAVHYLVVSCFALFAATTLLSFERAAFLALDHRRPRWWQLLTSLLMHNGREHLMHNMFELMVFGTITEEDMGPTGMLLSFLFCGAVSNTVSLTTMPRDTISLGSSGAIFGLFSVSALGKILKLTQGHRGEGWTGTLVEAAVYGWFVVDKVMQELAWIAKGGIRGVDHAAHFGGVLAGALLILLVRLSMSKNAADRSKRGR